MKGASGIYPMIFRRMFFLLAVFTPLLAQAHPGLPGHSHGFANGLMHPLTGWDHLLAMTAVGLWAVQGGKRALWVVPLAFVSVMTLGGMLGMAGMGQIPFLEQGIAASVLILGVFIATAAQLPLPVGAFVMGIFALFHGYAHGAEMPATESGWLYGLGFVLATASLHLCGIGLGLTAQRLNSMKLVRCVGGLMAICGVYLFFTA
ncbi:MAG: HupE/UreJ family protein [Verrucomicrobiota bacterium]|jgi:urease accessory protein